jgi:formiminoglutamase
MKLSFQNTDRSLFFKSPKQHDTRLGELVKPLSPKNFKTLPNETVIVGYPDDEGVQRNYGRIGASHAPEKIREYLYKLAASDTTRPFYDCGDFKFTESLENKQSQLKSELHQIYKQKTKIVSLGGGNDYAYPDVAAFLKTHGTKNSVVVHIDAHFDMRPTDKGVNSGTPLLQCYEEFSRFNLWAIGIQQCANTSYFFNQAQKLKVKVKTFEDSQGQLKNIFSKISAKRIPAFLAIDMDAFSDCYAPGVSAPQSVGLDANEFYLALPTLFKKLDVRGMGIYETNPAKDIDDKTSRLAARFVYSFLNQSVLGKKK